MIYDVIIIGGGAAGLNAALYASRGRLKTLVLEGMGFGGQVNYTANVENYLGIPNASGAELSELMHKHSASFGAEFSTETVKEIKDTDRKIKKLITRKNIYETKTIIFATGATSRKLSVMGEDEFSGAGVSYCATCDGAFYKDKTVAVIGGGNTAFEDAVYLSNLCKKVYLINRTSHFRAEAHIINKARSIPNIEILTERTIEKIQGSTSVKSIVTAHSVSKHISLLDVDGVFIAIGKTPNSELLAEAVKLAEDKSIVTDEKMQTSVAGIFAAGDVRNTPLRQIITAAADGAIAANSAIAYINS